MTRIIDTLTNMSWVYLFVVVLCCYHVFRRCLSGAFKESRKQLTAEELEQWVSEPKYTRRKALRAFNERSMR